MGLSGHEWAAAVAGAAVGVVLGWFLNLLTGFTSFVLTRWRRTRPIHLLLQRIADNGEPVYVFVRDFGLPVVIDQTTKEPTPVLLTAREGLTGSQGFVPNIPSLWSRVEASAYSNLRSLLSLAGKSKNVHLIEMSNDTGKWDASIVVLGAQAERCFQFYERMTGVAFSMTRDGKSIRDEVSQSEVPREGPYGYGIILKARNSLRTENGEGTALLIGGFGVLGTEAAGYYLRTRYREIVRLFGGRTFGIVIRAASASGAESAARVSEFDRAMEPKSRWRRAWEVLPGTVKQVDMKPT